MAQGLQVRCQHLQNATATGQRKFTRNRLNECRPKNKKLGETEILDLFFLDFELFDCRPDGNNLKKVYKFKDNSHNLNLPRFFLKKEETLCDLSVGKTF